MTTFKKSDYEQKGEFAKLPDDTYVTVLDDVKLDLANKFGARVGLTFKHVNNRLSWSDVRANPNSPKGPLAMAWFVLKKLDVGTEVSEALKEDHTLEDFLTAAYNALTNKVGSYYAIELKTTKSQKTGKEYQNTNVVGLASADEFSNFEMPKANNEPQMDDQEQIPF